MVSYEALLVEQPSDGVMRITINRPDRLNAISDKCELELDQAFAAAEKDDGVRVVILTGSGDKAFSTGYDMYGDSEAWEGPPSYDVGPGPYLKWWHDREERHMNCLLRIWELSKPVIAAVNGYAIAGGLEYAMMCDITIASENAVFGEPEIRHISSPPTLIMPWVIGWKHTKRLLLTGDLIDAKEAYRIGLVTAVVSPAEIQDQALKLAERIAHVPRLTVKYNKLTINRAVEMMGLRQALAINLELTVFAHTAHAVEDPFWKELEAAQSTGGLKAYLKVRDGWFKEQAKGLKV